MKSKVVHNNKAMIELHQKVKEKEEQESSNKIWSSQLQASSSGPEERKLFKSSHDE